MKVLTDTTALREMRKEILELILSEHPVSCIVCGEKEECRGTLDTIRKAGVTTGCRYCPNDAQCDLQSLAERLGVTEIHYPILYRGYEPEHEDPFFDRDYNLCILCGRCVRMCQEVRGTSVLAFKHRGPRTRIGPAFGRNHVQAGCEFCGACVTVCPTGALAEKVSKWDGKPDGMRVSTCPFCALGCQIELHRKNGRLSKVEPHLDAEINDGQLCVRGRFCLPETTHHHERARKPVVKRAGYFREVNWTEALEEIASRLGVVGPEDVLMVVSPDLTNESLYAAQKFIRTCLKSNNIDSTARWALPGGAGLWANLFARPVSIKAIAHADSIVAVGLDSRFSFSVAGVEIRRALRDGASLVTIDSRESNLARYTEHWLRTSPGKEGAVLQALAERLFARDNGGGRTEAPAAASERRGASPRAPAGAAAEEIGLDTPAFERAAAALERGKHLSVVVGPTAFALDASGTLGAALLRLGGRARTTILPLYQGANTRGALELGTFGGFLPGLEKAPAGLSLDDLLEGRARPKLLYLVGESPFFERPDCEFIIAQDLYRPPFEVDAFLPAASFAEADGTLTNVEGRIQESVKIEDLPDGAITGFVRPDWLIFGALAERLGCLECRFESAAQILGEIHERVAGFPATADRRPRRLVPKTGIAPEAPRATPSPEGGHRLVIEPGGFRHRGIDLSCVVEGLSELRLEDGFGIHPDDMDLLGLASGDEVLVAFGATEVSGRARADAGCPRGVVFMHRPFAYGGLPHRSGLAPLFRADGNPCGVTLAPMRDRAPRPAPAEAAGGSPPDREDGPCTES